MQTVREVYTDIKNNSSLPLPGMEFSVTRQRVKQAHDIIEKQLMSELESHNLQFYVIYSFDCLPSESVKQFQPPNVRKWDLTENYLDDITGDGLICKHRKYTALLTYDQFKNFVDHVGVYADTIETMGSITEYGWLPAISFNNYDDCSAFLNAYVTPIIPNNTGTRKQWAIIREFIINEFQF